MKLGFVFDTRFLKYENNYYSVSLSKRMLEDRYLNVFDEMVVVGREKTIKESPSGKLAKSNSDRITFRCIEDTPPIKRVINFKKDSDKIREILKDCDAVICRGFRGTSVCRKLGKPYLVEVVNCAWDSYWNHGILGKLVAPVMYLIRRISTKNAPYVQYVTNEFLQRRYPTNGKSVGVSDVALQEQIANGVLEKRLDRISQKKNGEKIVLGTAAAVNVRFKGQRFIIKAIAKLKKQGITNFEYQIVGGGSNKKLRVLAERLGVSDQVVFKGSIVHDQIFDWLDSIDIYVQPSLQEGLPRAMIEAMSRGLPCYGTKTGGIPELINPACVCSNNRRIADKFVVFLKEHTSEKAIKLAIENYHEAKKYEASVLRKRWQDFLLDFLKTVEKK